MRRLRVTSGWTVPLMSRLEYRFYPVDPMVNVGRIVCVDLGIPADDDQVVGLLEFGMPGNRRERMYGIVAGWLRVSEGWRRLGIATELWRRFLEHAAGRSIYAEYTPEGAAFIRSYVERFGSTPGLRPGWQKRLKVGP